MLLFANDLICKQKYSAKFCFSAQTSLQVTNRTVVIFPRLMEQIKLVNQGPLYFEHEPEDLHASFEGGLPALIEQRALLWDPHYCML